MLAVALLVTTFVVMREIFTRLTKVKSLADEAKETTERQIVKYSCWFTLSVLLNQISMYLIYRLSDRTPDLTDFLVLTGMCTVGVWISTHVVAACHRNYPRQAVIASLVAAGLSVIYCRQLLVVIHETHESLRHRIWPQVQPAR